MGVGNALMIKITSTKYDGYKNLTRNANRKMKKLTCNINRWISLMESTPNLKLKKKKKKDLMDSRSNID